MGTIGKASHSDVDGRVGVSKTMAEFETPPASVVRVGVAGIGGAGCNIISGFALEHPLADCIYMNTDVQALQATKSGGVKLRLGPKLCSGRAPCANPQTGAMAAEESREEIRKAILPQDVMILVAGMGGSTGSGALPVVVEIAQESGVLCIPVVTTPFRFEGAKRMQQAQEALDRLRETCKEIIVISNEQDRIPGNRKVDMVGLLKLLDEKVKQAVSGLVNTFSRKQ